CHRRRRGVPHLHVEGGCRAVGRCARDRRRADRERVPARRLAGGALGDGEAHCRSRRRGRLEHQRRRRGRSRGPYEDERGRRDDPGCETAKTKHAAVSHHRSAATATDRWARSATRRKPSPLRDVPARRGLHLWVWSARCEGETTAAWERAERVRAWPQVTARSDPLTENKERG